MSHRKTKKASSIILKEILEKYDLGSNELKEMKILLYEFVQIMNTKEVKEILKDYNIYLASDKN